MMMLLIMMMPMTINRTPLPPLQLAPVIHDAPPPEPGQKPPGHVLDDPEVGGEEQDDDDEGGDEGMEADEVEEEGRELEDGVEEKDKAVGGTAHPLSHYSNGGGRGELEQFVVVKEKILEI